MQPTAGLVLQPANIAVPLRQQLQHTRVIIGVNGRQVVGAQGRDRDRTRIVRVVLLRPARAEHAHSRRANRRHADHVLAGSDELLREETAEAVGGLDRPRSLLETVSPLAQTDCPGRAGSHSGLVEDDFVAVDRDSGVGALVRVDPDGDGHERMPFSVVEPRWALAAAKRHT